MCKKAAQKLDPEKKKLVFNAFIKSHFSINMDV